MKDCSIKISALEWQELIHVCNDIALREDNDVNVSCKKTKRTPIYVKANTYVEKNNTTFKDLSSTMLYDFSHEFLHTISDFLTIFMLRMFC